jgi:hypothetical protein
MYRSFGILNTSQPHASSRSRDAKFTSKAVKRNNSLLIIYKENIANILIFFIKVKFAI